MGWGDWTVAAAVRPNYVGLVQAHLQELNRPAAVIGEFVHGNVEVVLVSRTSELLLVFDGPTVTAARAIKIRGRTKWMITLFLLHS